MAIQYTLNRDSMKSVKTITVTIDNEGLDALEDILLNTLSISGYEEKRLRALDLWEILIDAYDCAEEIVNNG